MEAQKILSRRQVLETVGFSSTTLWRLQRDRLFPSSIRISPNRVGWLREEVEAWLHDRASERGTDQASDDGEAPFNPQTEQPVSGDSPYSVLKPVHADLGSRGLRVPKNAEGAVRDLKRPHGEVSIESPDGA